MRKDMVKILLLMISVIGLMGCQKAHLEIFPELVSAELIDLKLTPEQMKKDVDAFIKGAITRHPNLAEYAEINELKQLAELIKADLNRPMTRVEFFRHIGKLNASFSDGHTFLIWPYQEYNKLKEQGAQAFPFAVKLTKESQLVVAKDYQNEQAKVAAGQKLTHINGEPIIKILERLQLYVGGETKLLREHIVAQRFPIMLWSVYGFLDEFELKFEKQTLKVNRNQGWQTTETAGSEHYYNKLDNGFGYLYLSHFDIEPSEFEKFIDESFAQLKSDGVTKLIIDIRDNPGGNTETVSYLTSYIADKPFRLISSLTEKLNRDNRGWFSYRGEIGDVLIEEWDDWVQPIDSEERFSGQVYLMVSSVTYSAAIVLATGLQDHNFATLVGESTGGFANQSAQGNLFNLPNSQLRAFITTRLLIRPNGDRVKKPVVPDIKIDLTAEDVTNGYDAALELILTK